jgi:hypothetical protein
MDILDSEKLIIELNFRNEIVDERNRTAPFDSRKMFDLLPATVIDKRTLQAVEIHDLFTALDHSITYVGKARKIGFSPPDIERYLREKGYMEPIDKT